MNKLTDEQIVKALECCIAKENCEEISCEKCPLQRYADCDIFRFKYAIDLINRQRAEIEDLTFRLEGTNLALDVFESYKSIVGELAIKDGKVVGLLNGKETKYIEKQVAKTLKIMALKNLATKIKEGLIGWDSEITDEEIEYTIDQLTEEFINDQMGKN